MNASLDTVKLDSAQDIRLLVAGDIVPFAGNYYPLPEEVRNFRVYDNQDDVMFIIGRKDSSTITRLGFRIGDLGLNERKALIPVKQPFLEVDYTPTMGSQSYSWLDEEFLREVKL